MINKYNNDVIITKERIKHIEERRKDDADFVKIHMLDTIKEYDYIIDARDNCIKFIKPYYNKDNAVVTWLSLSDSKYANSILTCERINKKEVDRLLRNNKIIDIKCYML